jgi:hypothetical protein
MQKPKLLGSLLETAREARKRNPCNMRYTYPFYARPHQATSYRTMAKPTSSWASTRLQIDAVGLGAAVAGPIGGARVCFANGKARIGS